MNEVIIGFTIPDARPIALDLTRSGASKNVFVSGVTGSGKSVLGRTAIERAAQLGLNVIIIELKADPDYGPWYPEIGPFIAESSDPDVLGELLHLGKEEVSMLIEIVEKGDTWKDILEKLEKAQDYGSKFSKEHHLGPRDRRTVRSIRYHLQKLIDQMSEMKNLRTDLYDIPQISVMNLRKIPEDIQQIAARSTMEWVLENGKNTVIFIDEFKRISPQGQKSAAQNMAIQYASEGRSRGDFLVALNQSITGVNDDVRTNFLIWILGKSVDITKAERAKKQIKAAGLPLNVEDVTKLKMGEFYLCDFNEVTVEKIFVWAHWVEREDAIAVAKGEKKVTDLPQPPEPPAAIPGVTVDKERPWERKQIIVFPHPDDLGGGLLHEEDDWSEVLQRIERLEARVSSGT